jgi:triacylglycerol lipase
MRRLIFLFALFALTAAYAQKPLWPAEKDLPAKKSIEVLGQRIAYYDTGKGPVLVLVHGLGGQARFDFGNAIVPLSKHHRVIALDQVGFGDSEKPAIDYSIQTYVVFLGEFLQKLNVKEFALAGESLGGWIVSSYTIQALDAANTGPHSLPKPSKLIIIDAAGLEPIGMKVVPGIAGAPDEMGVMKFIIYNKDRVTDEFLREYWVNKMHVNDGFTIKTIVGNPRLQKEVVKDKLAKITIPALVVWGENDVLLKQDDGRAYAAGIPGAKLVLVPECGHVPAAEQPEKFVAAVEEFLVTK